jgi:hypothetical protein
MSQAHFNNGTSAFVGALLCRCHIRGSQDTHIPAVSAYATRRSSRLILRQRAAISADLGQCGCGASEQLRHVGGNRVEAYGRDGAGLWRPGDQDDGGVPAGLSSSMMISEPLTCVLARVVDLDKAGSFPV